MGQLLKNRNKLAIEGKLLLHEAKTKQKKDSLKPMLLTFSNPKKSDHQQNKQSAKGSN